MHFRSLDNKMDHIELFKFSINIMNWIGISRYIFYSKVTNLYEIAD